jgi:cytochrome c553
MRFERNPMKPAIVQAVVAFACALASGLAAAQEMQLRAIVSQCSECHGAGGLSQRPDVPNLASQHDRYIVIQLKNFRSGARPHKEMRHMSRQLTDEEIEAVAKYFSSLPHD